jgi:hypothetical protein
MNKQQVISKLIEIDGWHGVDIPALKEAIRLLKEGEDIEQEPEPAAARVWKVSTNGIPIAVGHDDYLTDRGGIIIEQLPRNVVAKELAKKMTGDVSPYNLVKILDTLERMNLIGGKE